MRYAAVVEYDGTPYCGFQRQANGLPTVQQAIEEALTKIARSPITVYGAGRTDTGVHATGQLIAFDFVWAHEKRALQNAINAHLPIEIAIRDLIEVEATFSPRFSAISRVYRYSIYNLPLPRPMLQRYSWHVPHPLDVDKMQEAAQMLVGEHDFASFGRSPTGGHTVRHVYRAEWQRNGGTAGLLEFEIEANAFLKRMVRHLVATLKAIGEGSASVSWMQTLLQSADYCVKKQNAAPPQGLTLIEVEF